METLRCVQDIRGHPYQIAISVFYQINQAMNMLVGMQKSPFSSEVKKGSFIYSLVWACSGLLSGRV